MPGSTFRLPGAFSPVDPDQRGRYAPRLDSPCEARRGRCRMSYDPPQQPPMQPPSGSNARNGAAQPPKKKKRSGSETRQRDEIIPVRCKAPEAAMIRENAAAIRLKPSGFLRMLGTGQQRPHERRPRLPELLPFTQALGKLAIACSNAYQLLRLANRGEYPDLQEVRETHTKLNLLADELLAVIRGYSGDYQR